MDGVIVFLHIVAGAVLAVNVATMQLGVGPMMKKIPAGPDKQAAQQTVQGRVHPAQSVAIVVMLLTALHLAHARAEWIMTSHLLATKVAIGTVTLLTALYLHFWLHGKKKKAKHAGDDATFQVLAARQAKLEKIVLVGAPAAFILGVAFNHL